MTFSNGRKVDPSRPVATEPDQESRPAELSDLIVFDYLTQNVDRWGGDFTNLRIRGPGGPLIYLDNGAGFWLGEQRLGLMEARLKALQRFRRATVEAVRRLDVDAFALAGGESPPAARQDVPAGPEWAPVRRLTLPEGGDCCLRRIWQDDH